MYLFGALPMQFRPMLELEARPDVGAMLSPVGKGWVPPAPMLWAADNGCFVQGAAFDLGRWLGWLERRRPHADRCLFAVAPDVVGDAAATLARSAPVFGVIRAGGYRVAFVSQDGCRSGLVPWNEVDCLFVGGTDAWKLSEPSYALCAEAKARGLWLHVGRVNSLTRLRACRVGAVDSVDGNKVVFEPTRTLPMILRWLDAVNGQTVLEASP